MTKPTLWCIAVITAQLSDVPLTDMVLTDEAEQQISQRQLNDQGFDEEWLQNRLMYSQFSTCKTIDDEGNKIRYRHHCDEGVFTVEIHACKDLGEPWVVRFDSLDRLGGCINIIEGEGQATITTRVGRCGTEYYKENGWVYLTNRLHIFRSIEDEVFDYNSYKLSCEYEELINFEYDLQGVSGLGHGMGLDVRFWESAIYANEIINLDFEIGQPIYLSFTWANVTSGLMYGIKDCSMKDKKINEEYAMINQGCVSTIVSADRHSDYFEKTKNSQYFEFIGFTFPNSKNFLTLSCRIKVCLNNDKACQSSPKTNADCREGYTVASGRPPRMIVSSDTVEQNQRKKSNKP